MQLPAYDPFTGAQLADPYPYYEMLRAQAPILYAPSIDHWVVSRYKDVQAILMDHAQFSARNTLTPIAPVCPAAREALAAGGWRLQPALGNNDEPDHRRVRDMVRAAFLPAFIKAKEPRMRALTQAALAPLVGRARIDLVAELTADLPARIILDMLGFEEDAVGALIEGGRDRAMFIWGHPDEVEQERLARGMATLFTMCVDLVTARMASPRDDFATQLVQTAAASADDFPVDLLASILFAFFTAGHETTSSLMANTLYRLLQDGDAWAAVCADPSLALGAADEVLRYDSSVIAWRRIARHEVEIAGQRVPAGAQILLLLGAANRDPAQFPDPDRFDIRRPDAGRHLSFGKGIHICLGNTLARTEVRILLEEITATLPTLKLSGDFCPTYLPTIAFRGPSSLEVMT